MKKMCFIIYGCLALLFSTNGMAMDRAENPAGDGAISFMATIESEQSKEDTRKIFEEFQGHYKESGVLHPWGLGQEADPRMNNMNARKANGNAFLDQIAYQGNSPVAFVNLGHMPVKGYENHPIIAQAWKDLGFTNNFVQNESVGVGYVAFGFASAVSENQKTTIIQEAMNRLKEKANEGKLLPIQNRIPTHFVSLIALADEPLINGLKAAGFVMKNTDDGLGFPGFDAPEEQRNRLIAVFTF
jgi:hypothetical protein